MDYDIEWEDASWLDLYSLGEHASDADWADRSQRKALRRARRARQEAE